MSLDHLNPPQREAVLHDAGPLVVFAGAGSGKTRVITHRVARLMTELEVPPWRILCVTFTNKAAQEMRERLGRLVPGRAADLWVGTFHATCARLLRRYAEPIGISRDFVIYDDADQKAMVTRVVRDLGLDEKRYPPKQVAGRINRAKQEVLGPDDLDTTDPFEETIRDIYDAYEKRMRQCGALDFGDLIYRLVRALEEEPALLGEIAGRFSHVLVDEFQDTNHAQYRLVRALTARHRNVCVVGDDDQSIYRWRGADRRNILDFTKDYADATVIKLEQNYRSTQRILRVANSVIEKNLDREPKRLWTENDEGPKVTVIRCEDERDEARQVVRGIRELLADGRTLADVAVFYRMHAQSRVLEEAMRAANIPYKIVGGMRFYDRAEIKDALAYLRIVQNPEDDVSLLRVINTPTRGIGKTTIEKLLDLALQAGTGVWRVLERVEDEASLGGATTKKLAAFRDLVKKLREKDATGPGLVALGEAVLEESGYLAMLAADDTPESDARRENLEELVGSMAEFAEEAETPTLAAFLELVTLQSSADERVVGDALTMMTVHAAKGLEFPAVIVTGLEEQMFPMRGGDMFEDPDEMEEERRLAYVAFTRAERRLVLTYAAVRRIHGQMRMGQPSRFLLEMPPDDLHQVGTAPSARQMMEGRIGARGYGGGGGYGGYGYGAGAGGGAGGYGGGVAGGGGYRRGSAPPRRSAPPPSAARRPQPRDDGESYVDRSEGSDFDGEGLVHGMKVRHAKFGVGRVMGVSEGVPPRVKVEFPGWGTKTITVDFLEPA